MVSSVDTVETLTAKRQLVADLKAMLQAKFANGEALEKKAIELFKMTSAMLGLVAALKISIADIRTSGVATVGLGVLVAVYALHVYGLYRVLKPTTYSVVPGIPRLATRDSAAQTFADFRQSYLEQGEDEYLEQTIVDLAGTDDVAGAIEDAEKANEAKAQGFQVLVSTFVLMIAALVLTGVFIVTPPTP